MRDNYIPIFWPSASITNADVFSPSQQISERSQVIGYAIQATWTGASLSGMVELESSNDGTTWDIITDSPQIVSGPGTFMWNVREPFYRYVRIHFAYTSGSGTITASFNSKGF